MTVPRFRRRTGSRNPGLVLPFALASFLVIFVTGAALFTSISRHLVARQRQSAIVHAEFVANSTLRYGLTSKRLTFLIPIRGQEYRQISRYVRMRVMRPPVVGVTIWRSDGTIIFSHEPDLVGARARLPDDIREVFARSQSSSSVADARADPDLGKNAPAKVLKTYVPLYMDPRQEDGPPVAVMEIDEDYATFQAEVNALLRTVLIVLGVSLSILWALLLPIVHRVSKRLSHQNSELREAEMKHRAVVENIPAITYTESVQDWRTLYISPQVETLLGITPERWIADPSSRERALHPEDRAAAMQDRAAGRQAAQPFASEYRMVARDGRIRWFRDEAVVLRDERGKPTLFQGVMLDVTEGKLAEEQLAFLAYHDNLTRLPNRSMFEEMLELALARARRHNLAVGVLYMDLDDFKLVNDSLGHSAGDELLRQVADRLRELTRDTDVVARQGGDEFLVLLADVERDRLDQSGDRPDNASFVAESVAARIQESLRAPFTLGQTEVYVSASIGISLYPDDASDAESLLTSADSAMYESKNTSPGNFVIHSQVGGVSATKLSLSTRLRRAVEEGDWVLHYQPIVDLATGRINGVEALIRWPDPRGGLVPPGEFIPLAEEMGLIEQIGEWVLSELARQHALWRDQCMEIYTSFNLSPRQLWQADLVHRITEQIRLSGIDPGMMVAEITESAAMTDPDRTRRILGALNERGVRLAIDDFGTGHSSLARLKHLPVDMLKIDRSFIREVPDDPDTVSMVRAMIELARSLRVTPLAEGIESEAQWRFLLSSGCSLGQGFYFSGPVPPEQITSLVIAGGFGSPVPAPLAGQPA
jgi:diguanylate cyclase (GGDEF)-like protein/PAS domain S-box-containing protein